MTNETIVRDAERELIFFNVSRDSRRSDTRGREPQSLEKQFQLTENRSSREKFPLCSRFSFSRCRMKASANAGAKLQGCGPWMIDKGKRREKEEARSASPAQNYPGSKDFLRKS